MLAAVFEEKENNKLVLREKDEPKINQDTDLIIKVEAASICGTDVHILANPPGHPATHGIVQGHEYVGEVVDIGTKVKAINIGDRVVIDPTTTCGSCYFCKNGAANMCENSSSIGVFMDGGWASYSVVPAQNVHKISKHVPIEHAVLAEPLSCVINGIEKINIRPGDNVVILGSGPMGQLFTQVSKISGAGSITCSDFSDFRLDISKKSGASCTVNPKKQDIQSLIMKETRVGADIVIDCTGVLFDQSIELVKRGGQVLLVGMNKNANPDINQYSITRNEISVKGTYIQNNKFPKVVKILESNLLNLKDLITHKVSLVNIHQGIEKMSAGEAVKIVVYP